MGTNITRIAIEAQNLFGPRAGIGQYIFNLVKTLLELDKKNTYTLIFFTLLNKHKKFFFGRRKNLNYRSIWYFPYRLYRKLFRWGVNIPLDVFAGRHDLYLFPDFHVFPTRSGKSVAIIYDLVFERFPEYTANKKHLDYLRKVVPEAARRSDQIVAISEFTKREIADVYKVDEEKITVIHPGLDHKLFRPLATGGLVSGRKKPFILLLGTIEPRKNIVNLIRAYARLPDRDSYNLVIAGMKGWKYEEIFQTVEELGLSDKVIFPGYVLDDERPKLLQEAEVFVYPSFYEGFGMPVVEAQACGTPVITSNTSSLPEAAGEGALFVDPNDVEGLSRAMNRLLKSEELREDLIRKGLRNAGKYSWEKSARKLLGLFDSLK